MDRKDGGVWAGGQSSRRGRRHPPAGERIGEDKRHDELEGLINNERGRQVDVSSMMRPCSPMRTSVVLGFGSKSGGFESCWAMTSAVRWSKPELARGETTVSTPYVETTGTLSMTGWQLRSKRFTLDDVRVLKRRT